MVVEINKSCNSSDNIFDPNMTPFIFDLFDMIIKIRKMQFVEKVCFHKKSVNLDIYVIMESENLDVEDKIMTLFTNWEQDYKCFPEIHIMPRDIMNVEDYLPEEVIGI